MEKCIFENKKLRNNPSNKISAFCYQIYDDLKLLHSFAELKQSVSVKKQLKIIKQRIEYLENTHSFLDL